MCAAAKMAKEKAKPELVMTIFRTGYTPEFHVYGKTHCTPATPTKSTVRKLRYECAIRVKAKAVDVFIIDNKELAEWDSILEKRRNRLSSDLSCEQLARAFGDRLYERCRQNMAAEDIIDLTVKIYGIDTPNDQAYIAYRIAA